MSRLEAHMIEPIRRLMHDEMGVTVTAGEFSAGYGIADLVGAVLCERSCERRAEMGMRTALDHHHLVEVLLALREGMRTSFDVLLSRVTMSESTLRKRVLPRLSAYGVVKREHDGYVALRALPPRPTKQVIAVEAKQTRWRQAILQARRYSFFADRAYIAVWKETALRVDRVSLYRHRLGLIAVDEERAEVAVEAPVRRPREEKLRRYCSEHFYGLALAAGEL